MIPAAPQSATWHHFFREFSYTTFFFVLILLHVFLLLAQRGVRFIWGTLIYQTISFHFFSQISASTVSKQITCNHFGLSFEGDSDRTVSVAPPKPKCSDDDPHYHCTSVLGPCCRCCHYWRRERPGCDLKDAECLDEKQVFFQLLSELHDSKDSDPGVGVAAHPRWRWRRMAAANRRYHPQCWPPQHYQHPYQHCDHPSLQCERSPSWSNNTSVDFDASVIEKKRCSWKSMQSYS